MILKKIVITVLCLLVISSANAGIRLNKTRVIFNEKSNIASITFVNTGKDNYLVEAAVVDPKLNHVSENFIVIPPVFRSEGEGSNVLKIIRKGGNLVSDRESDYKLVLNAIPASEQLAKDNAAKVSFSLGIAIKLFYRPESLKNAPTNAYKGISFYKKDNSTVVVKNDSEYNISLSQLILGKQNINLNEQPSMIRPFSSVTFKVADASSEARWRLIDDYGGESKEYISKLQNIN
ncbi:molecular chaperone [Hafnia alvei]|uniref:fimbrial biogenesis chaperone n=1 Tax=Hafnia alvei TaxID=569 RepID=UPI001411C146|nr:molecular chaperone [Hafnia alvei]QIP58249.1 molecular chaperone [Hafnia alvei]